MTTIITRLYATEEAAVKATAALKRKFGPEAINLVTPANSQNADIAALTIKGGVLAADASAYAEKIQQGHSLVTVHAPWSFAQQTIDLLESHGPVDADAAETERHVNDYSATPFSDAIGWSVLKKFKTNIVLSRNPAPFSAYFNWKTLTSSKSSTKLVNDPAPFSKWLNLSVLSNRKPSVILSERKAYVTLVKDPTPFSTFFNLPVLFKSR